MLTHSKLGVALDIALKPIIIHDCPFTVATAWVEAHSSWVIEGEDTTLILFYNDVLSTDHTSEMDVTFSVITLALLFFVDLFNPWLTQPTDTTLNGLSTILVRVLEHETVLMLDRTSLYQRDDILVMYDRVHSMMMVWVKGFAHEPRNGDCVVTLTGGVLTKKHIYL